MNIRFGILLVFCAASSASEAFVVPTNSSPQKAALSPLHGSPRSSIPQKQQHALAWKDSSTGVEGYKSTLYASGGGGNDGDSVVKNPIVSAFLLIALDVAFRRLFQKLAISFPSSLGGCCALFASMLLLPKGHDIFQILSPGASLLAKWLPVFFVPSLVTLPLAGSVGPPVEILKIFAVILGGFYFTLLTTAGSVVWVRKLFSGNSNSEKSVEEVVTEAEQKVDQAKKVVETAVDNQTKPAKPFSDELTNTLRISTAATAVLGLVASKMPSSLAASVQTPMTALFMLLATLNNFVFGARLPKSFTKVVHPLVTCTSLTWAMATAFGAMTGSTFRSMLKSYRTGSLLPATAAGAGDVLLFLLGPAVVSLAVSMYDRRKLMQANLKEVGTGVGVSSVGGLFGTALMVRLLQLASPALRLSLLSRNITSPLAMAIASILGADVSLAVSMVVVTGLIGANFGASILSSFGIQDPVARGMGIGAAAHGLGTAAFVNEPDAFPFAAISMALTATACTCLVSVPIIKRAVIQLALGV